jgi:hypothetical protein
MHMRSRPRRVYGMGIHRLMGSAGMVLGEPEMRYAYATVVGEGWNVCGMFRL